MGGDEGTPPAAPLSTHPVFIIGVVESTVNFQPVVGPPKRQRGMRYAVELGGLDHGIMNHIFENQPVAYLKGPVERPITHIIAAQATVAADPVGRFALAGVGSAPDHRFIWHFQTIGHMAGERGIDKGRTDAVVLHYIYHGSQQETGLPGKGASWLQNDFQIGILGFERAQ